MFFKLAKNQVRLNLRQYEFFLKKKKSEVTSRWTDSAWGATHQSMKWSNLRMQELKHHIARTVQEFANASNAGNLELLYLLKGDHNIWNSSEEFIDIYIYIYNIISDEIMIFETPQRSNASSNLVRGDDTIHKQRRKTTSFLDAHTTFKLHWPITRPISKTNIASFTGPLPGQSQKPILPDSFGCSLLVLLLLQSKSFCQEGQYIPGDWNLWSLPFASLLLLCDLCC